MKLKIKYKEQSKFNEFEIELDDQCTVEQLCYTVNQRLNGDIASLMLIHDNKTVLPSDTLINGRCYTAMYKKQKFLNAPNSELLKPKNARRPSPLTQFTKMDTDTPTGIPYQLFSLQYQSPVQNPHEEEDLQLSIDDFPVNYIDNLLKDNTKRLSLLNKATPVQRTDQTTQRVLTKLRNSRICRLKELKNLKNLGYHYSDDFLIPLLEFHGGNVDQVIAHLKMLEKRM
ncbi:Hypothetical_protein [Hexamita inflata]|uniref:Hypothetical_protein n=1 Tax=Hexamita inflata TaxID=28002 RepID=A0AA86TM65_9EUKA|nr:Hypothetical protein HINF_LOCUS9150 [Hexamita inflata]CAI9963124.1 Hypothetical protein HINF_LOCUS50769 [Hexamita inflata]